jgi:hypothetical protein
MARRPGRRGEVKPRSDWFDRDKETTLRMENQQFESDALGKEWAPFWQD